MLCLQKVRSFMNSCFGCLYQSIIFYHSQILHIFNCFMDTLFFFFFFFLLVFMTRHTGRIVVYYKCGVYDATDFSGHPGGVGRLEMAAGVSFLK